MNSKLLFLFLILTRGTLDLSLNASCTPRRQVQPRHRQLERRCSTLEQPPQWSLSGGDGWVSASDRWTRLCRCHRHSGKVLVVLGSLCVCGSNEHVLTPLRPLQVRSCHKRMEQTGAHAEQTHQSSSCCAGWSFVRDGWE